MTFTITRRNGWSAGYFDPEEAAVYLATPDLFFPTPQAVLDHVCSEAGAGLQLGTCGLVFIHVRRDTRKGVNHFFQSLRAANRFHKATA